MVCKLEWRPLEMESNNVKEQMQYVTVKEFLDKLEIEIKTGPFGTQLKAAEYQPSGTPVLNVKNLGYSTVNTEKLDRVGDATIERLKIHLLKKNDIVFGRKGAVERHAFISDKEEGWMQGSDCIRLRVKTDKINPHFLSYYFLTKQHRAFMVSMCSHGTTMASLNQKILEQICFPIPERNIQDKIVNILEKIDRKIVLNNRINNNLKEQAQLLYKQIFPYSPSDKLPGGWRIGTAAEIIEIHDSKRVPLSGAERMKMEKKTYPYYGAASLMDYVESYIFDGKYLLLGEDGTVVDDAGYPILQYVWGKFWVNNHAHILTGKLGFNVESLYMLFKQTPVKSIVTGAVQLKISQANLKSISVVIPPKKLLREYNNQVESLFTLIRTNEEENNSLLKLGNTLLPKLMSGEIDVSAIQI